MIEKGDIVISYSNVYIYLGCTEGKYYAHDYLCIARFNSIFENVSLTSTRVYDVMLNERLSKDNILELSKFLFKTKKYTEVANAIEYNEVPNKLINIRKENLKLFLEE